MSACAFIFAVSVLLLSSCSSSPRPPLQATWYFVEENKNPGTASMKQMYVGILNRSTKKVQIKTIVINPLDGNSQSGWLLDDLQLKLVPGKMLFRPITDFKNNGKPWAGHNKFWDCRLPVHIIVVTDIEPVQAKITGPMPTSVPLDWEKNCFK